jgi:integrase
LTIFPQRAESKAPDALSGSTLTNMAEGVYRYGAHQDRWAYVIWVRDAAGQAKKRWVRGFRSERAAVQARREALAARDRGEDVAPSKLTLREFLVEQWLPAIRDDVRASTCASYETHVRVHIAPRIGQLRLQRLTPAHIKAFHADLATAGRADGDGGLGAATIRRIHATLHRALRDAVEWELVVRNAAAKAKPPKGQRPVLKAWSADGLTRFLDHVDGDRLAAMWQLLASTGMRRSEVAALAWSDVDLERDVVTIRRAAVPAGGEVTTGAPKSERARRTIALDAATAAALRDHRRRQLEERLALGDLYADSDRVFTYEDGQAIHPARLSTWFAKLRDTLGLPKIPLHGLRHTHAALLIATGGHPKLVQERLGHHSAAFTLDV